MPRPVPGLLISAFCLILGGCDEELGPEVFPTANVRGTVRVGPNPIRGGFIEFHPYIGTQGTLTSSPIAPDGTFEAKGVPVGEVLIGFENLPGGQVETTLGRFPSDRIRVPRSGILRKVGASPTMTLDIDLHDEILRILATTPR